MKQNKNFFIIIGMTIIIVSITITTPTFALKSNSISRNHVNKQSISQNKTPKIIGKVSEIDGKIIKIQKNKTIYTIDTSNSVLNKFTPVKTGLKPTPTLILVSDIKIGDILIIEGEINGANISAKTITDGSLGKGRLK